MTLNIDTCRRFIIVVFLLAGLLIAVAGCGNDADVGKRDTGAAKAIINMPDKFPNVAHKCYAGNTGVYVSNNTTNGSGSPAVVPNDPNCP